ncbi:hypothetical protein TPA0910_32530 [Streptomyces hygroscopicus subsp. sporocinereus]|uniref:Integral membrane protein n=1 Tax=Streptomyces hygroscopicus TaxID=1912 RepID=A0ABQ3TZL4_STRHY|nr:hypothetical protein TPA0910_32530 [Streptomyces hygroscopicus]
MERAKGKVSVLRSWAKWLLAAGGVILTFWLGLLLGRWLPFGVPEDEGARWGVATALASAVSAVVGLPLVRWAGRVHQPSQES